MLIVIDPGHGGRDRANRGPTGYVEADGTLAIAKACRCVLEAAGVKVIMTRETDEDLAPPDKPYSVEADLIARARIANNAKANYFVSVHTNAFKDPAARGTETHCYSTTSPGFKLAKTVQDAVVGALGTTDRGVKVSPQFIVLRYTAMPAVLVEVAYHTNPEEERLLKQPAFLRKAGEAVAVGILRFLGLPQPDYLEQKALVEALQKEVARLKDENVALRKSNLALLNVIREARALLATASAHIIEEGDDV